LASWSSDLADTALRSAFVVGAISLRSCFASLWRIQGSTFDHARDVYDRQCKSLGTAHRDSVASQTVLGLLWKDIGQFDKTEKLFEKLLQETDRLCGAKHQNTLALKNNLALVLSEQDKIDEAITLFREVLAVQQKLLGDEHPSVLFTQYNMALMFRKQGKKNEALRLFFKVLVDQAQVLGAEHPDTLRTKKLHYYCTNGMKLAYEYTTLFSKLKSECLNYNRVHIQRAAGTPVRRASSQALFRLNQNWIDS
jgi:tetratricopeptide (TPR) repeat protein